MLDTNIPEPRRYYTKLDAAITNINAAIKMWFSNYDPLPIELVARAAYDVVHALFEKKYGNDSYGYQFVDSYVKEEYVKDAKDRLRKAYNFAKHADRDPDGDCTLYEDFPRSTIISTLLELFQITETRSFEQKLFMAYMVLEYPDMFVFKDLIKSFLSLHCYKHTDRFQFYVDMTTIPEFRRTIELLPTDLAYWQEKP